VFPIVIRRQEKKNSAALKIIIIEKEFISISAVTIHSGFAVLRVQWVVGKVWWEWPLWKVRFPLCNILLASCHWFLKHFNSWCGVASCTLSLLWLLKGTGKKYSVNAKQIW